jgi:hypothetical protein
MGALLGCGGSGEETAGYAWAGDLSRILILCAALAQTKKVCRKSRFRKFPGFAMRLTRFKSLSS